MSKSKFALTKGRRARRARRAQLDEGELEEAALDQVAGGGRAVMKSSHDMAVAIIKNIKA